jgi:mRNA-degrading endonuclease RelE of RelBE toxin-antitoxin system
MVNPKRNRALFRSLIEAQLAESRFALKERLVSYQKYRARRGQTEILPGEVSITQTVRNQLAKLDEGTFKQLDSGILKLSEKPRPTGSKPKHYRWFLGDLRRVILGEFPIVYTSVGSGSKLTILFIGFRNWKSPQKARETANDSRKASSPPLSRRRTLKLTDLFIAYSGETAEELFSYPPADQYDSLVHAFREGIQQKAEMNVEQSLTPEERIVLAVTALQQEVNNGGYDQFFRNDSRKFAPVIVDALQQIGCRREANITANALQALHPRRGKITLRWIDRAMARDSFERDQQLDKCDRQFYKAQTSTAKRLYRFIRKNRKNISFGTEAAQQ